MQWVQWQRQVCPTCPGSWVPARPWQMTLFSPSNLSILRARKDSDLSLALPFQCQAESWSWLPAHPAGMGPPPHPHPTCACGWAPSQGDLIVFPTHALSSLQPTACPSPAPLVAMLQAHTRPGTLPVTPAGLPTQSLRRAEIRGPTQAWLLLILFRRVLECPSWLSLGFQPAQAPASQTGARPRTWST